jgi:TetR/AcrR family transcriptional regulator, transcriptional repressor for nem operon
MRMIAIILFVKWVTHGGRVGASKATKAATHERILDIAAARIRSDGIEGLAVADLMKEAGLTHGGFYRHFDSQVQLVAEAAQRALVQGSKRTVAAGHLGSRRGYTKLVDAYLSAEHRDHPESGCGIAGIAADVARKGGPARASYTKQVEECLRVVADLLDNLDPDAAVREAALTVSALVGAITISRALGDSDISRRLLINVRAALSECLATN